MRIQTRANTQNHSLNERAEEMSDERRYTTVPREAAEMGIDQAKILGWIHRGELFAINVAERAGGKPRWRIPTAAWQAFLESRGNRGAAPAPRAPRRRNAKKDVPQYY